MKTGTETCYVLRRDLGKGDYIDLGFIVKILDGKDVQIIGHLLNGILSWVLVLLFV